MIASNELDRLVEGTLPDAERRALLLRLEREPDGWRKCALAFLEAQMWRESLAAPATAVSPVPCAPVRKPRRMARWSAVAAGVAAAFFTGYAVKESSKTASVPQVIAKAEEPAHEPNAETMVADAPKDPDALIVEAWRRRGYEAEVQKRQVSLKLRDGRVVEVPLNEVRLRQANQRVY